MAFSFSEEFWPGGGADKAKRCRCKYHSDLLGFDVFVSTVWKREDEGQGNERYEVRATADSTWCADDHGGATDDQVISRAAWDNAAPNRNWDFFPNI